MNEAPTPKFFWNGAEVPEAMCRRLKFCWCGNRNEPEKTLCAACLKSLREAEKVAKDKATGDTA